jgi:hypothetical protein
MRDEIGFCWENSQKEVLNSEQGESTKNDENSSSNPHSIRHSQIEQYH